MLMDVFSSFDGHSYNFVKFAVFLWFYGSILLLVSFFSDVYVGAGSFGKVRGMILSFAYSTVKTNGKGLGISGFPLMMGGLFSVVLMFNLSGNIPCFYPVSGNFSFGFSFAFTLWMSLVVSSFGCKFEHSFMRLVPTGCPLILVPLMVMIEAISGFLRPITLTLRMSLNLATGKVILTMVGGSVLSGLLMFLQSSSVISELESFTGFLFAGSMLVGMELCMACLQCYVFCMLLCLYTEDHSN